MGNLGCIAENCTVIIYETKGLSKYINLICDDVKIPFFIGLMIGFAFGYLYLIVRR